VTAANIDTPDGLTDEEQAYVDGLRELADWLEAHPAARPSFGGFDPVRLLWPCGDSRDGLAAAARVLGRAAKSSDSKWVNVTRLFGPHQIQAYASHEAVCERVVVGTETIETEVPDPEALKNVPTIKVTETVEQVEWRCPPSLLAATEGPS
jgi:hypothetical protein